MRDNKYVTTCVKKHHFGVKLVLLSITSCVCVLEFGQVDQNGG